MNYIKLLSCYLLVCALQTGCSTHITRGEETYNTVSIQLDHDSTEYYKLYNERWTLISSSKANGSTLSFKVDHPLDKSCLYITDSDGERLSLKDSKYGGFSLKLAPEYQRLILDQSTLLSEYQHNTTNLQEQQKNLSKLERELSLNRAATAKSCRLPVRKPLPQRPALHCNSHDECQSDASAICTATTTGAEACNQALGRAGVTGALSGPACGALVAQALQKNYRIDEAFFDAFIGYLDQIADDAINRSIEQGDLLSLIIGAGTKLYTTKTKVDAYNQCVDTFMGRYYTPLREWQAASDLIIKEPEQSLSACKALRVKQAQVIASRSDIEKKQTSLATQLDRIYKHLNNVHQERKTLTFQCSI